MNLPISKVLMDRVVARPEEVDSMRVKSRSKYRELAQCLDMMDATKSISYTEDEVIKEFGKHWRTNIPSCLKNHGVTKPRARLYKGNVHIYKVNV